VKATGEFGAKRFIDHAMCLDPAPAAEGLCDDVYAKMGFPLRTGACVTLVVMGLVDYLKSGGREGRG
jgi:hypothetical protein